MAERRLEQTLRDVLTVFDTVLDTPVMAGALNDWVQAVRKAFESVAGVWRPSSNTAIGSSSPTSCNKTWN